MRIVVGGARKLAEQKAERLRYIARINHIVGEARKMFITPITGQEMIYLAKEQEAIAYLSLSEPPVTLDDFPMIASEIGITGEDAYQIAQIWMFMSAQWRQVAAYMENLRLLAINQINAVQTSQEREQILKQLATVLKSLQ